MKPAIPLLASILALSACAAPPPLPSSRQPLPVTKSATKAAVPTPTATAKSSSQWIDWPLSAGDWVYRRDQRGSLALFGPADRDAVVTLRCDTQRQRLYLARSGNGSGGPMLVRSSSAMKEFAASPTGGTPPFVAAEIMPSDPILDALAFSRGRIAIEASGLPPLAIPSWSEISKVVEDCRN